MRFLLISDTHGKLSLIDAIAAQVGAEAVIHAGDFGFFDQGSADRPSSTRAVRTVFRTGSSNSK